MSISPARTAAFDILLQVEKEDAYASELLHSARYAAEAPHLALDFSSPELRDAVKATR